MRNLYCTAIVAQFIFGAQRCNKPAVAKERCEEYPECPTKHPVCEDHVTKKE